MGKFSKAKNKWLLIYISKGHKPNDPDEKERIIKIWERPKIAWNLKEFGRRTKIVRD